MDAEQRLRARIAAFPGYESEQNRRLSDELVRSYLGEALAEVAAGDAPLAPELADRFQALLLRIGFADPKSFSHHNSIQGPAKASDGGEVAEEDAATVELADRMRSSDRAALAALLDEIVQTLERREAAMRATAGSTTQ